MCSRLVGVGRIISGEVIVLTSPEWEDAGAEAGRLLRLYQHPLTACVNDEQRRGWMAEDERIQRLSRTR